MEPIVRLEKVTKAYRGVPAVQERRLRSAQGRDPRAARRERRRQVDADQDHGRRRRAELRHACSINGREVAYASPHAALEAGIAMVFQETSLVPSMTVAQNLYLGTEKLPQPAARHLHLGAAIPAVAELPGRPDGDGRDARRRQAADGRDRPRRPPQCRGHHLRRADGGADAGGEAPLLRADAAAEGERRVDRLHQPCAGRGAADRRPHHHPARRRAGLHRRHGRASTATSIIAAMVGRTLSGELYRKRDRGQAAQAGQEGAVGAGHLDEQ